MGFDWTKNGFALSAGNGDTVLRADAGWLVVEDAGGSQSVTCVREGDGLAGSTAKGISFRVASVREPGVVAPLQRLVIHVSNESDCVHELNLKWTLLLGDQESDPDWLIPALWYRQNYQAYTSCPTMDHGMDLAKMSSPYWLFRSDLTAVPFVLHRGASHAVALAVPESVGGQLTSVGFDSRSGRRALLGAWPLREEPRRRKSHGEPESALHAPLCEYVRLEPRETREIYLWFYVAPSAPYAFAPLLREWFERNDVSYATRPWFPVEEGASHAAHGLFNWHYDPDAHALWETCAFANCYTSNPRQVHRYEMHTSFTSGIPHAYFLQRYGRRVGREDMVAAGRDVINMCCSSLTPVGTFWSKYAPAYGGWTTGWPQPQRPLPGPDMAAPSGELHARTLAEAVQYAAQAAMDEEDVGARQRWTDVVRSNLDFVLRVARDGNPGQNYLAATGEVLDWDGEEGILWIAAFVEGWRLTGHEPYLAFAKAAGAHYRGAVESAYLTGAPEAMHLLPTSEDPQNAIISYMALWEETGDAEWVRLAGLAAELFMTFRWQYNVTFPHHTLLDAYGYCSKGIDVSSPNNVDVHPYSVMALPAMLRLWEETGDAYFLRQTRNNLHACNQMLAPVDGAMDARRGMMTERWVLTDGPSGKGSSMPLAHSWCAGVVLQADMTVSDYGGLLLNGETGDLIALDALLSERMGDDGWRVVNPWPRLVNTTLTIRCASGTLYLDGHRQEGAGGVMRCCLPMPASGTVEIRWDPSG